MSIIRKSVGTGIIIFIFMTHQAFAVSLLESIPISCFNSPYYKYGSVQAKVNQKLATVEAGNDLPFGGVIINNNQHPISEALLYVKIVEAKKGPWVQRNGYNVVDQFVAVRDLPIAASSSKQITFTWKTPKGLAPGEYRALYYVSLKEDKDISGLNFSDDITANQTSFKVTSKQVDNAPVFFVKDKVTLNGMANEFARPQLEFLAGTPVTLKATLKNPSKKETKVIVTYKYTDWGPLFGTPEVTRESFVIPAGKTQEITKTFYSKGYVAPFILVSAYDETTGVKSELNIRYSDDKKGVRAHYLGVMKFPLKEDEQTEVYTCFHALNETGYGNGQVKVELRGYDRSGREIFSKEEMTSSTNLPKQGLAYKLQATRDITYLKLESVITADGVTYSAATTYDCLILNNCPELKYKGTDLYKQANKERSGTSPFFAGTVAGILFILITGSTVFFLRKKIFKDKESEKPVNN